MSIRSRLIITVFVFSVFLVALSADKTPGAEQLEPKALFEKRCSRCHSLDKINKTESEEGWRTIVNKMKKKLFSGISNEDAAIIIEYLAETKGLPGSEPGAAADKTTAQ